jgi:hypothetical protein
MRVLALVALAGCHLVIDAPVPDLLVTDHELTATSTLDGTRARHVLVVTNHGPDSGVDLSKPFLAAVSLEVDIGDGDPVLVDDRLPQGCFVSQRDVIFVVCSFDPLAVDATATVTLEIDNATTITATATSGGLDENPDDNVVVSVAQ